jgi:hypothetical protein
MAYDSETYARLAARAQLGASMADVEYLFEDDSDRAYYQELLEMRARGEEIEIPSSGFL